MRNIRIKIGSAYHHALDNDRSNGNPSRKGNNAICWILFEYIVDDSL